MEQSQLNEIRQLLQEVADPYEIRVQVNQVKSQLSIILNRQDNTQVDYSELTALIEEKLKLLIIEGSMLSEIESFRLLGRVEGESKPEWQTTFSKQSVEPTSKMSQAPVLSFSPLKVDHLANFGWVLFIFGALIMAVGFTYDATVESDDYERIYNIGAISNKSSFINTGGFMTVCGAIFITNRRNTTQKAADEQLREEDL